MTEGARLRDGRYAVTGTLGEGAQGTTLDAIDLREGRPVAIKRFDVRGARSWKDVELAEREARVLSTLDHPLLPRYVEHFEEGGALYLVMEKIDGESLAARGGLHEDEVVAFLGDAADVLGYLHGRSPPLVHRDVKPRNVLRRKDGRFVLVDFGAVAERLRPQGGSTVVGTMGYMAPEQLQGRALPATDVYAVGATAVAMLTGQEPETLPHRGLRVDVRAALRGRASGRLVDVLERMLEPDPDRRASDLGALVRELRTSGRREEPRPRHGPGSSRGERRRRKLERLVERRRRRGARAGALPDGLALLRVALWVAWGFGWAIVRPFTSTTFMFVWMAATLIADRVLRRRPDELPEARVQDEATARAGATDAGSPHVATDGGARVATDGRSRVAADAGSTRVAADDAPRSADDEDDASTEPDEDDAAASNARARPRRRG